ncbi:hypothetical protein DES53_102567 [Roseimicrobium gellanilyticum]|uniref:Uncharacterized protein n=1 Tax=Roseimicrobium gellanilyticum TaxID=748857 RepID=A0A366HR86_9BACT|nr:hypothetical protein [Roseimicrobium gellanilyticum]RBP46181.1 hypothetical protein DES53_102567 [Roseimicrobium gellanilyticum]
MKLYYALSQIPEVADLRGAARRSVLKAAGKILQREDPWFTPSIIWLFSLCCGALTSLAITVSMIFEPWLGLRNSAVIGFAAMILPAIFSAFAVGHVNLSRIRPYIRQARNDREALHPVGQQEDTTVREGQPK